MRLVSSSILIGGEDSDCKTHAVGQDRLPNLIGRAGVTSVRYLRRPHLRWVAGMRPIALHDRARQPCKPRSFCATN